MLEKLTPLILDTSVVAKWFISESDSELANVILEDIRMNRWRAYAPALLRAELAQVFWKLRTHGYSKKDLSVALDQLGHILFQEVSMESLETLAIEKAFILGISVYDGYFVALAQSIHGTLVTFDRELARKSKAKRATSVLLLG